MGLPFSGVGISAVDLSALVSVPAALFLSVTAPSVVVSAPAGLLLSGVVLSSVDLSALVSVSTAVPVRDSSFRCDFCTPPGW